MTEIEEELRATLADVRRARNEAADLVVRTARERDAAVASAEAAEAERDDLRKRLQSCAESVCAEERKTVAAEARIAAALAIIERGENVDVGDEDDHAVFALGWANAAEEIRAALVEPVGPKEDA